MILPFDLSAVHQVIAYKRDEITTDLICIEVVTESAGEEQTWIFHEEQPSFEEITAMLSELPGFLLNWRDEVIMPPFARQDTILYSRDRRRVA